MISTDPALEKAKQLQAEGDFHFWLAIIVLIAGFGLILAVVFYKYFRRK